MPSLRGLRSIARRSISDEPRYTSRTQKAINRSSGGNSALDGSRVAPAEAADLSATRGEASQSAQATVWNPPRTSVVCDDQSAGFEAQRQISQEDGRSATPSGARSSWRAATTGSSLSSPVAVFSAECEQQDELQQSPSPLVPESAGAAAQHGQPPGAAAQTQPLRGTPLHSVSGINPQTSIAWSRFLRDSIDAPGEFNEPRPGDADSEGP